MHGIFAKQLHISSVDKEITWEILGLIDAIQESSENTMLNSHEITVITKPQPLKQDLPCAFALLPVVCILITKARI